MTNGQGWRQHHLTAVTILAAFAIIVGTLLAGVPAAQAYDGPGNNYACTPNPAPSAYYNGAVQKLKVVTHNPCAANPSGQYLQVDGRTTVWGGGAYFYIQQNPDGYTQLSLNEDNGWYTYWQQ